MDWEQQLGRLRRMAPERVKTPVAVRKSPKPRWSSDLRQAMAKVRKGRRKGEEEEGSRSRMWDRSSQSPRRVYQRQQQAAAKLRERRPLASPLPPMLSAEKRFLEEGLLHKAFVPTRATRQAALLPEIFRPPPRVIRRSFHHGVSGTRSSSHRRRPAAPAASPQPAPIDRMKALRRHFIRRRHPLPPRQVPLAHLTERELEIARREQELERRLAAVALQIPKKKKRAVRRRPGKAIGERKPARAKVAGEGMEKKKPKRRAAPKKKRPARAKVAKVAGVGGGEENVATEKQKRRAAPKKRPAAPKRRRAAPKKRPARAKVAGVRGEEENVAAERKKRRAAPKKRRVLKT